jgi:hypothetical protein
MYAGTIKDDDRALLQLRMLSELNELVRLSLIDRFSIDEWP